MLNYQGLAYHKGGRGKGQEEEENHRVTEDTEDPEEGRVCSGWQSLSALSIEWELAGTHRSLGSKLGSKRFMI